MRHPELHVRRMLRQLRPRGSWCGARMTTSVLAQSWRAMSRVGSMLRVCRNTAPASCLRPASISCAALIVFGITLLAPVPPLAAAEADVQKELASIRKEIAEIKSEARRQPGRRLYNTACMACHGRNGDGRGPMAGALRVKPRDFRQGTYKWRTTPFGALPTDDDLDRTIRDGVSGTEMVPFGAVISAENRALLVEYIKTFSPRFKDSSELAAAALPVSLPAERPFPRSAGSILAGKTLYAAKGCATCHGEGGKGDGPVAAALVDSWGWPIRPWDFTQGYYKSGRTDRDLFRTITTGLNGTPMPGFGPATTVAERWQLVDYLASLANGRSGFWFALFRAEPTGIVYGSN